MGAVYYRLKVVDLDNGFSYTYVVSVLLEEPEALDLTVFPNPVIAGEGISIQSNRISNNDYSISLVNSLGVVLYQTSVANLETGQRLPLDPEDRLSPGMYFIVVRSQDNSKMQELRFVVH